MSGSWADEALQGSGCPAMEPDCQHRKGQIMPGYVLIDANTTFCQDNAENRTYFEQRYGANRISKPKSASDKASLHRA